MAESVEPTQTSAITVDERPIKKQDAVAYGPPAPGSLLPDASAPTVQVEPPTWAESGWRRKRPPAAKINAQRVTDILMSMEAGVNLPQAALAAGVGSATLKAWLLRGESDSGGIYVDFLHAVREAEARCEDRYVTIIANKAQDKAEHAQWMLERKFPQRYGQRVQITVEAELTHMLDKLRKRLSQSEYEKVLEAISSDAYVEDVTKALPEKSNAQGSTGPDGEPASRDGGAHEEAPSVDDDGDARGTPEDVD
jgi:hypothetical protein